MQPLSAIPLKSKPAIQHRTPEVRPRDWILLGLLAYLPFSSLLQVWIPIRVLGFSGWITVFPTALIVVTFFMVVVEFAKKQRHSLYYIFVFITLLYAVAIVAHQLFVEQAPLSLELLVRFRYLVLLPIYLLLWRETVRNQTLADWTKRIVLVCGWAAAVFGALYVLGLPTLHLPVNEEALPLDVHPSETRYGGPLTGENCYGNFLVLPLLTVFSTVSETVSFPVILLMLVSLLGILGTGSRLAMGIAAFLSVAVLFRSRTVWTGRIAMGLMVAALWYAMVLVAGESLQTAYDRFSLGIADRSEKAAIAIDALTSSFSTFCLGTRDDQLRLSEYNADQFSDNSYLLTATNIGVPGAILFLIAILRLMRFRLRRESFGVLLTVAIFATTFYLNNAVLWDAWVFWSAAVYWLTKYEHSKGVGSG